MANIWPNALVFWCVFILEQGSRFSCFGFLSLFSYLRVEEQKTYVICCADSKALRAGCYVSKTSLDTHFSPDASYSTQENKRLGSKGEKLQASRKDVSSNFSQVLLPNQMSLLLWSVLCLALIDSNWDLICYHLIYHIMNTLGNK